MNAAAKLFFGFLRLSTPFLYAAFTYWLFHWLDKKASAKAKRTFSKWLEPKDYRKEAMSLAILEAFDRIYTRPLLHWRGFLRSTLVTIGVTIVAVYEFFPFALYGNALTHMGQVFGPAFLNATFSQLLKQNLVAIGTNIVSDFCGLLVIRRLLIRGKNRPVLMLFLGPVGGTLLIFIIFIIRDYCMSHMTFQISHPWASITNFVLYDTFLLSSRPDWWTFFFGAMVVYLWLPLLALAASAAQALNYFRLAVGWARWFLKRGQDHPLEAIGYVAAIIVFTLTVVSRLLFAIISGRG